MVTGEYPPMQGGVGAFTREVARALAALGHPVSIFTRAEGQQADEPGITVAAEVRGRWGWRTIPAIRAWVRERQIELINIQFQTAAYNMHPAVHWLPSRLAEVPVVVTFHDLRVPYLFPKAGKLRPWIVRKLAADADGTIATDHADEAVLRDEWRVLRVCWVPIGSNVTATRPPGYDRKAWRASLGTGPDELLISYFGFLNESKGGLVLIEALARLVAEGVRAHLVMIGGRGGASDPTNLAYGERVDAAIARFGLVECVHWTGFVDDAVVSAHFYASDLCALPYLDGVSLRRGTLMAALAHGRAIVTTAPQTSAPELDGVVEVVPPGDASALAEAIARLWRDSGQREALEAAALDAAQQFSWEGIARRTLDFYQAIRRGA